MKMPKTILLQKESAAMQKRHHVMITDLCNSNCIFCLATEWKKRSCHFPAEEVKEKIRQGLKLGAKRLVLSGGEPTIHPEFVDFVKYAKEAGYGRVQAISNGKMFYYEKFLDQAIDAGLDEVTFSLPSHLEKDFEKQTGVKGSYKQSIGGLVNAIKSGKLIVSVDVVVSRMNVEHLRETLDFYIGLGVAEFDLLQVIPFGSAWKNRDRAFYDPAEFADNLKEALAFSKRKGVYIWTNRLPARYLEGHEDLIQDPHKLYDEARGRDEMFRAFAEKGVFPRCHGERCRHCFMEDFCRELIELKSRIDKREISALSVDLEDISGREEETSKNIGRFPVESLLVKAGNEKEAMELLPQIEFSGRPDIRLQLRDWKGFGLALDFCRQKFSRIALVLESGKDIEALANLEGVDLEIFLNKETARHFMENSGELAKARGGVVLTGQNFRLLSGSLESAVDYKIFFKKAAKGQKVRNIPPCLCPGAVIADNIAPLDVGILGEEGTIIPEKFVGYYIEQKYYSKSLRCAKCSREGKCPGLHINYVRHFGFKDLEPTR